MRRLILTLFLVCVSGCGAPLTEGERLHLAGIRVLEPGALHTRAEYQPLREAVGVDCVASGWSTPNRDNAMIALRRDVVRAGGNAVIGVLCREVSAFEPGPGCIRAVECRGSALVLLR